MVATSLDTYDVLINNYPDAKQNLESLRKLGATIIHGVDATQMKLFPDLQRRKFDRIIYNFPHAGFHGRENDIRMIKMHQDLVQGFFKNASLMLTLSGKIHVNHKTEAPYDQWNLEGLAGEHSLALDGCVAFRKRDYPGYKNKKGSGPNCNKSFRLEKCNTFMFKFSHNVKKKKSAPGSSIHTPLNQIQQWPSRPQKRVLSDVAYYPLAEENWPSNFGCFCSYGNC
ncbi:hypothetical protein MKW94_005092 [Papaver nudicaule]|uniref:25S rRNA (uridine-N(3))-methyltransferase BMT5-like domain-containing protein n=1 Tax=Papaver nudicaule TaxID=74823 RepID=A0AA41V214_PAPNU|nr:hypothetical protein [Papaver nudicaule]